LGTNVESFSKPGVSGAFFTTFHIFLYERYGKLVPMQLADSELQLDELSDELTLCPTIYWTERGA